MCDLQALFGNLTLDVIVLTMLYSTAGLGIAIVNDFKSIEGDRYSPAMPSSIQRPCLDGYHERTLRASGSCLLSLGV